MIYLSEQLKMQEEHSLLKKRAPQSSLSRRKRARRAAKNAFKKAGLDRQGNQRFNKGTSETFEVATKKKFKRKK